MPNISQVSQRGDVTTVCYDTTCRNYDGYIPETVQDFIENHEKFHDTVNNRDVFYQNNDPKSDYWFEKLIPGSKRGNN